MLLTQKYAPAKIDDVAGNETARIAIKQWMLNWLRGVRQKPLLICGPTGTGKTSIAYALANEYDLELIEMNASDLRDSESVNRVMSNAGSSLSLSGKGKLLLIDDADAFQRQDRGGSSAVGALMRAAAVPIIVTACDVWDKKMAPIRAEGMQVELKRISRSSVNKVLNAIVKAEGMDVSEQTVASLAERCNGDLRSAINDLQTGVPGERDRDKDIFERVRLIFKSTNYKDAREASFGDVEHDLLKLWIDENIALEYENAGEQALAYDYLSRGDIFDGRIMNRQYWGFLRYSNDLMTAGVALSKQERYVKFTKYQFPGYLRMMSSSSAKRAMLKAIGLKIGERTHTGWREARDYIHIMKHILDRNPDAKYQYRFEDEEVAFIFDIPVSEVKERFKAKEKEAEVLGGKDAQTKKSAAKSKKKSEPKPQELIQIQKDEKAEIPQSKKGTLGDFL